MAQQAALPYVRKENAAFGEPRVLDVDGLRNTWLPWVSLQDHPTSPVLAKNALKAWERTRRTDADDLLARPWTSMIAPGGLRSFVLAQARTLDHLAQPDGHPMPAAMQDFRNTWQGWLTGDDPLRRVQATAILGALTASQPVVQTEEPDLTVNDPLQQHYCYERAKVLRARNPEDARAEAALEEIARHAVEPAIRTLATVNVITYILRFQANPEKAWSWIEHGAAQLPALFAEHPQWLGQVIANHFHRIKALHHTRQGEHEEVLAALEDATAADEGARTQAAADLDAAHVWSEGHSLLLGVKVRYHTRCKGDPAELTDVLAELERTDPYNPESRKMVAELYASADRLPEAAEHFERAAQGGTVQGAMAAYRAYQCHTEAGDAEQADRALRLLADLDPSADIDHYAQAVG
ncbi:hypothetical protein [Streptomyces flaveolus]|uniref:hypothetical protein n=1 Tax=Streptomyces flaveolus TaxID=67297 RepID=UPI0033DC943C